jgi:glutathione S-transferase
MILIGMFDSPYVRRVAISMALLDIDFEHRNWSVGRDFDRIREFNPQGRVPTLVLDDGEALTESAMIVDHLDQLAGPQRALLPVSGRARRDAQSIIALATGAVDKGILIVMERIFRPLEKHHPPFLDRCRRQVHGALEALDARCAARAGQWLVGDAIGQADITLACYANYLRDAVPFDLSPYPALLAHCARCEALPVFARFYVPFDAPQPTAQAVSA